jgi:hypothetical protein
MLLAVGPASASIASPPAAASPRPAAGDAPAATSAEVHFEFTVKNLPAGSLLLLIYFSGVQQALGGQAQARAGGIGTVDLLANSIVLGGAGNTALDADVTSFLSVDAAAITGTATIPAGASVSVTNLTTHKTIGLTNGPFSIPTGVGTGVGAPPPGGKDVTFSPRLASGVDITGPASAGQPVELAPDSGSPAQVWTLTDPGDPSITQIINKQTGLCLDSTEHAAGAQLIAATCNGSKDQQWAESQETDGTWRLSDTLASPLLQAAVSIGTAGVVLEPVSGDSNLRDWIERSPAS